MDLDNEIMPFGKHKGEKLANIPASYFLYLIENNVRVYGVVRQYIKENEALFIKEAGEEDGWNESEVNIY